MYEGDCVDRSEVVVVMLIEGGVLAADFFLPGPFLLLALVALPVPVIEAAGGAVSFLPSAHQQRRLCNQG